MNTKLFVGGIPFAATDASLADHFSAAGQVVSARIITDKFTGRSRGFGFVEFSNSEEAQKAISMFDGSDMDGRKLAVSEARPMREER